MGTISPAEGTHKKPFIKSMGDNVASNFSESNNQNMKFIKNVKFIKKELFEEAHPEIAG
jgi:hypothetical protein